MVSGDLRVHWKDSFAVGDPTIDAQHKAFFEDINRLAEALDGDAPHQAAITFYRAFRRDLARHFREEEEILQATGFPDLSAHGAEHEALLASVQGMEEMLRDYPDTADLRLMLRRLFQALIEHVIGEDMRYRPYLRQGSAP
ncbi:bacteriohemerythrin [Magnetospirillum sp. UT-4]|uniref:bacteriohemerythrin n=1 Tax=Magnetospirillum sp. UT-4 TaxID=2681467 RepID=UPI001574149B|nr:hemerythrin family protein [Magnetospirillum sp. UT-4]